MEEAIDEIHLLDERLLGAVAGQENEVATWVAQRKEAVQAFLASGPGLAGIEDLQGRTQRLEDRFLHWRRTSIMELSLIEQHLRYLHAQRPDPAPDATGRIDVSA